MFRCGPYVARVCPIWSSAACWPKELTRQWGSAVNAQAMVVWLDEGKQKPYPDCIKRKRSSFPVPPRKSRCPRASCHGAKFAG